MGVIETVQTEVVRFIKDMSCYVDVLFCNLMNHEAMLVMAEIKLVSWW